MTKYDAYNRRRQARKPEKPHPIWRGIGCLIIIIVPLISLAAAKVIIDYGLVQGWPIPYQLLGNPILPDSFYEIPLLILLLAPVTHWTNLYAYLSLSLLLIMIFGGILTFLYAFTYRFVGPPRWGPQDVPPPKGIKPKPYKR